MIIKEKVEEFGLFLYENWKGIAFFIVFSSLTFVFFYFKWNYREYFSKNYDCYSTVEIISFKPQTIIKESVAGNVVITDGFFVEYRFDIGNNVFSGKEYIGNTNKNRLLINELKSGKTNKLIVKYRCSKPNHNSITLSK